MKFLLAIFPGRYVALHRTAIEGDFFTEHHIYFLYFLYISLLKKNRASHIYDFFSQNKKTEHHIHIYKQSIREQTFNRASTVSDCIGNKSLTYRIQADTYRESAATDGKFILTGIPVSIWLGLPIFRYEPAGTARTGRYLEPCIRERKFALHRVMKHGYSKRS